ncbi:MAG: enoyl-CoA hydratase/isomerase family protein [Proteobacteria bacterium]|nr:enoyl-CoA hydratase/isomerase family protein [Pseudomonadota bacterium]
MTDSVLVARDSDIAIVTLNRPERLNAWDTPMRESIRDHLAKLNGDDAVRAIIVTGAGDRAFCAGQDLEETQKLSSGKAGADWFQSWKAFYGAFRDLDKPLVAAVNGVAAGSAFQVAMLCDILVGHKDARMGQPEINSGIPTVLGTWLMRDRIGLSRTTELTLTGRMMDGDECHRIGLFHYLVTKDQVMAKAKEIAALMAAKPAIAMRLNKRRLREITQAGFEDAIQAGKPIQAEAYQSGEPQRHMAAFFAERAKRKKG